MTNVEKLEKLQKLEEQQLHLQAVMSKSDAHASKCSKLNISFKDEYPTEYDEYVAAREQYNINQERIAELESACIEEDDRVPFGE